MRITKTNKKGKSEEILYQPVLEYLESRFKMKGECHLEITAGQKFSEQLKRRLDDFSLYIFNVEKFIPDIMGYVITSKSPYGESRDIIVTEVKAGKIQIKDILQTRGYGAVYEAKYALLISSTVLPEEIRRFYDRRYNLAVYYGYERVKIGRFDPSSKEVKDWYPEPPFKEWQ